MTFIKLTKSFTTKLHLKIIICTFFSSVSSQIQLFIALCVDKTIIDAVPLCIFLFCQGQ